MRSFTGGDMERPRSSIGQVYTTLISITRQNNETQPIRISPTSELGVLLSRSLFFLLSYFLFYCEIVLCVALQFVLPVFFRSFSLTCFGPVLSPLSPRRMFLNFVPHVFIDLSSWLSSGSPGLLFLCVFIQRSFNKARLFS